MTDIEIWKTIRNLPFFISNNILKENSTNKC